MNSAFNNLEEDNNIYQYIPNNMSIKIISNDYKVDNQQTRGMVLMVYTSIRHVSYKMPIKLISRNEKVNNQST